MSENKLVFILTSAGRGDRFGKTKKGKQFELINGTPTIIYSLKSILKLRDLVQIIITVNKEVGAAYIKKLLKEYSIDLNVTICNGGRTRAASVFNAFKKISGNSGLVIIHDSARPSLNSNTIKKMSKSLGKNHGIILASKVRDTIKKTAGSDLINKTLKRETLWHSETPQIFKYSVLKKCYETDSDFSKYTDEAQLLENNGYRVKIFENNEYNKKITTKEDLNMYKILFKNV